MVAHFVRCFAERQRKQLEEIPEEVIATLQRQAWPGNVRELQIGLVNLSTSDLTHLGDENAQHARRALAR